MRISGTIDFIEIHPLNRLIDNLFKDSNIDYRTHKLQDSFDFINSSLELYIYPFGDTHKKPRYLFEGDINLPLDLALTELHRITHILNQHETAYCLFFHPNKDDEDVSIELRSVGYYKLYEELLKR